MALVLRISLFAAMILASGCVTVPEGPSVLVLPGTGKNFDQFRSDDRECRQFASGQVGGTTASQAGTDSGMKSAVVGTIVGAAAGAAIDGGRGATTGAGAGLLIGGLAGTDSAQGSALSIQKRYDFGYQQCMYAKGHRIPVSGRFTDQSRQAPYPPPPPPP
jgi:hypothetical protein